MVTPGLHVDFCQIMSWLVTGLEDLILHFYISPMPGNLGLVAVVTHIKKNK